MKTKLLFTLFLLSLISPIISLGGAPTIIFEENKNQWPEQVRFQSDIPGGKLFLEKDFFTYSYAEQLDWHRKYKDESVGPVKQKMHCIKVNFLNSNPNVEVSGNNKFSWHRNYYIGNDPKKWADNVPLFGQVYYKNLYENIDMQVYNSGPNIKYDIIIYPGGNVKDVKFKYDGTDGMRLEEDHLFIKTSLYDLIEQKPYAYQEINGIKTEVSCSYVLNNNVLSYSIKGKYDASLPLVIDPTLIASTYSGSNYDNWGYTATYDAATNIYIGGICAGQGYPTTVGAHDLIWNGGMAFSNTTWPMDISLTKFNPTGTGILFSTYYGGNTNEQPHSIVVNNNNELIVVGRTNSTNFPVVGAYQPVKSGGYDIIVGKFNTTGALLASTHVGGSGDDCVNFSSAFDGAGAFGLTKFNYADDGRSEVIIDNNSNVYIAACTRSANFPCVNFYDNTLGGAQDAVVIKLNSSLSALTFSTYLGGSNVDAAYGLKLDNSNNVLVTGGTASTDFPTTAGVLYTTYRGGLTDGFISILNSTGNSLLRSTYLGTTAYDQCYMIEIDASGDLYVYGQTMGAYPVTAGVYSNPNSKQFVHKVSGLLNTTVFSTVVGSGSATPNISPTAFLVDSCQTIYLSGWGRSSILASSMPSPGSTTGMPVTANAYDPNTDGGDLYFMVLKPNAQGLFYATFFGQNGGEPDHIDGGTSRFDKRGVIYQGVCASCGGGQGFPTTPGAWSATNNGSLPPPYTPINCNQAVVKMDVSVKPLAVAVLIGSPNGCVPHTVAFNNTGSAASYFIWDFGDGSPIDTILNPTHTYSFVGSYTLTLYAVDSIGICGYIDTATLVINVGAPPTLATNVNNILCNGGVGSATVTPTGGFPPLTYVWNTSPQQTTSTATGLSAGTYTVTVSDSYSCAATSVVTITNPPPITASATTQGATCGMSNGSATVTAGGGTPSYTYSWSNGASTSAASNLPSGPYTYTVTDMNGCTVTGATNISVANGPTVTATPVTQVACNGNATGSATATQTGGTAPYTYAWGTSPPQTTQVATGLAAGTYSVIVTDVNGCSSSSLVTITQPPALAATISSTNVLCFGGNSGTASVTASGGTPGYNYSWSPSGTGPNPVGLPAGQYTVIISDANGCTTVQTTNITQPLALNVSTTSSGSSCGSSANGTGSAMVSGGTAPYTYSWNTAPVQTTPTVSNLAGGTYVVTITDANGCTSTGTISIPISTQPNAIFTYVPAITCDGISFKFFDASTQALSWLWNFGDPASGSANTSGVPNPIHVFPYNGTYIVSLIVSNPPCKDTMTATITVGDITNGILFNPATNVFTPNGDPFNDCFHPAITDITTGLSVDTLVACIYLEVFDRWGVKMFESGAAGTPTCWDGNVQKNGKPAVDGTYYYIAKLGSTVIKGYLSLLRK